MNAKQKQHLEAVVESIVNADTVAAKAAFHEYLRLKSQSILLGEAKMDCEDEEEMDCEDEEEEKDSKGKFKAKSKAKAKKDEKDCEDDEECEEDKKEEKKSAKTGKMPEFLKAKFEKEDATEKKVKK